MTVGRRSRVLRERSWSDSKQGLPSVDPRRHLLPSTLAYHQIEVLHPAGGDEQPDVPRPVQQSLADSMENKRPRTNPGSAIAIVRQRVSRHLSRRLPYYLIPEEAHSLIESTETERDHLFLELLWGTGVRVSEAIALRLASVGRDGIRVLGKGGTERVVFVQQGLVSAILFHAQEHGLERDDYLFPSRKGGHITKQRADQIIKKAARRANLQRNAHAHLFRHGYAINFLNFGGRLDALQEQLGHRDINTTRIYLRLSDEDVKREVAKIQF